MNIENSTIEVLDIYGNLKIKRSLKGNTKLDVQSLVNGAYFIKIYSKNKVQTKKFTILK